MQAPENDTQRYAAQRRQQRQHDIRGNQQQHAARQHGGAADAIRDDAGGIGRDGIDDVHGHQHGRHERDRQPDILGTQNQECLAEARQREHAPHRHHPPIGRPEVFDLGQADRIAHGTQRLWPVRLTYGEDDQRQRQEGGNHGKPEHRLEVV